MSSYLFITNRRNLFKIFNVLFYSSNSKKGASKRSITVVKEETVRNTTPPVKGKKRKHSEISVELNQSVNVQSPSEPKPKKRGNLSSTIYLLCIQNVSLNKLLFK